MVQNLSQEEAIFQAALEIGAPDQRAAYLDAACAADSKLRQRIDALLCRCDESQGPLDRRAVGFTQASAGFVADRPGTIIGPYKLLEQIGEGGFGVVFMAEQSQPVRRKVAVKLIKPGMDSKQVIARFEAERQALAIMDHPNIAKIHDGGATPSGRPYFVMELVKGEPITHYCDVNRLTSRARLELFGQVCAAVQHAHQKGIIHRDIKPSNVLVVSHDGTPVVKIIDFGVAKALGEGLTDKSLFTGFAQMIGTPLYMSPEQAGQSGLDIDTRSDIYSLGVLLYELLTGSTPFDKNRLRGAGHDEIRRFIREEEPPKPSTRVSTVGQAGSTISAQRQTNPQQLCLLLRGELDWIVMKALEKDRNRRYESASAFAADVQRHLNDEQVEACPPSTTYRLRKFSRRNRRAMVTAAIVLVALVSATAVSAWQTVVARDAQKQAEAAERRAATEAAIARAVNSFLQDDLLGQASDPVALGEGFQGGRFLTVKEALDRAATQIDQRFTDQPLVEASIQTAMGQAYLKVYEYRLAVPHLKRATSLRKAHLGDDHADTIHSMEVLAEACKWVGQFSDAVALYQQIVERNRSLLGPDDPTTLLSMRILNVALHNAGQRDWGTSVRFQEQLLDKQRRICGPTDSDMIGTMHNLAIDYGWVDRFAESIDLHEKVLRLMVSNNENTSFCMLTFAHVCQLAGKLDQAEHLLHEALKNNQARGDSRRTRIYDADTRGFLARNLLLQERYDAAEPFVREAMGISEKEPGGHHRFYWVSLLGAILIGQQKYAEAEPYLLQGYEGMKQREPLLFPAGKRRLAEVGERIVAFYELTQQPEQASLWRVKLGQNEQLKAKSNP